MLTNGHGPVDRARAIAPIIAGESESIDRVARLTSAALAALVDANLFRACAPSEIGGNGCDLRDAASIAGILGSADVSTGWLFVQANSSSFNFGPGWIWAHSSLRAADAYQQWAIDLLLTAAASERSEARLAVTSAMETALGVVDACYRVAGTRTCT